MRKSISSARKHFKHIARRNSGDQIRSELVLRLGVCSHVIYNKATVDFIYMRSYGYENKIITAFNSISPTGLVDQMCNLAFITDIWLHATNQYVYVRDISLTKVNTVSEMYRSLIEYEHIHLQMKYEGAISQNKPKILSKYFQAELTCLVSYYWR